MKIVQINIKNFLKLKDVEFNPSHTNVISGKNRQGKTSILKAIKTAFSGGADSSYIRVGETKAEITIELEDLTIRRSITEKGSKLDISNKEGFKMESPQKYLDGVIGNFAFNPLEFINLKPADRKKYLLSAIKIGITKEELAKYTGQLLEGLDYNAHALEVIEQARKFYYDQRTVANAEVTKKRKSLEDLNSKIPEGFDASKVNEKSITDLRVAIQTDKTARLNHDANQETILRLQKTEKDLQDQIFSLTNKLKEIQEEIVSKIETKFDFSDDMAISAYEETLQVLESQRDIAYTATRAVETRAELDEAITKADKLDLVVTKLTKEVPEDLIKNANLPIAGLKIDGNEIFVGDINIENMSTSEQLRFGLEIVKSLNGELKLICIDGIESLDQESFASFLEEIKDDEFTYFVTRVDGNTPHSIVVDDGEIIKN